MIDQDGERIALPTKLTGSGVVTTLKPLVAITAKGAIL